MPIRRDAGLVIFHVGARGDEVRAVEQQIMWYMNELNKARSNVAIAGSDGASDELTGTAADDPVEHVAVGAAAAAATTCSIFAFFNANSHFVASDAGGVNMFLIPVCFLEAITAASFFRDMAKKTMCKSTLCKVQCGLPSKIAAV